MSSAQQIVLMPQIRSLFITFIALLLAHVPAQAHEMPFGYLDLELGEQRVEGRLTVHVAELARELGFDEPHELFDGGVLDGQYAPIEALLDDQLLLADGEGRSLSTEMVRWEAAEDDKIVLLFHTQEPTPGELVVDVGLFPATAMHQTFVNIYEGGELRQQFLFNHSSDPQTHYAGTVSGVLATIATFVPSGAHHVLIGPDHVLFLIGLILLGGSLRHLTVIVTAFTLGHSVTLALAALDIFTPPAWLIEPAIALSIVVVGADNLLRKEGQRDLRPWFALLFGLIHGFGFAFVLREFGLPSGNLAWSLFSFNLGVELGQLAIVIPCALILGAIRQRFPQAAKRIVIGGSLAVVLAGLYWFVDRVRILGSG